MERFIRALEIFAEDGWRWGVRTLFQWPAFRRALEREDPLRRALSGTDLYINPQSLEEAATEIDCGERCERSWHESDTNAGGCYAAEKGEYCPNLVACLLRDLAAASRKEGN